MSSIGQKPSSSQDVRSSYEEGEGTMDNPETWAVYKDLLEDAILIAVMGATGSGKSSLIRQMGAKKQELTSLTSQKPVIGHSMGSKSVEVYTLYHDTRRVIFVETPGFDHFQESNIETLKLLAAWLTISDYFKWSISGVIYTHPMTDDMTKSSTRRNLEMFKEICGFEAMEVVTLVMTMWGRDNVKSQKTLLEDNSWLPMLATGAQPFLGNPRKEIPRLLKDIVRRSNPVRLLVQTQLVDLGLNLAATHAGKWLAIDSQNSYKSSLSEEKREIRMLVIDRLRSWTFDGGPLKFIHTEVFGGVTASAGRGVRECGPISVFIGALTAEFGPGVALAIASGALKGLMAWLRESDTLDPAALKRSRMGTEFITDYTTKPVELSTLVGTPTSRLSNPKVYFEELEELKQAIFERSVISQYSTAVRAPRSGYEKSAERMEDSNLRIPIFHHSPRALQESTLKIDEMCNELLKGNSQERDEGRELYHLLECRNIAQRILWNICRLQLAGYISDRISLITTDEARENVAHLVPIQLKKIEELLKSITSQAKIASKDDADGAVDYDSLTSTCRDFLATAGLSQPTKMQAHESGYGEKVDRQQQPMIWRCAVHTLDLAVVLYAGAHMEPSIKKSLNPTIPCFHVPGPYVDLDPSISASYASTVYQHQLECLDGLLDGAPVWVFHAHSVELSESNFSKLPLHLATDSGTLADVWGPMWEERIEGGTVSSPQILSYKIGNGSIFPWMPPEQIRLSQGELYCHWMADSDQGNPPTTLKLPFTGNETLVIGATYHLEVNDSCSFKSNLDAIKFRHANRITLLTASEDTWQLDTQLQEFQGGFSHLAIFNGKIGRGYKRQFGQTWKKAFIEVWDPAKEDGEPLGLELYMGVKMSCCTENASRVTVRSILLSDDMRRFFDPDPENDFIRALEPRRNEENIITRLWEDHPEWRNDIRRSVYRSLKALENTGLTNERGAPIFNALWNQHSRIPASKISFPKFGWMEMLSESIQNGCVALLVGECLTSDHKQLRRCQSHIGANDKLENKSALRTSFILDGSDIPSGLFAMGTEGWLCTKECTGKVFSLNYQGNWRVDCILHNLRWDGGLLLEGKKIPSLSKRVKAVEFDGSFENSQPLPVLIR